jgi:hypothetical protein
MAITVIFGLLVSTVLTLVVIPLFYLEARRFVSEPLFRLHSGSPILAGFKERRGRDAGHRNRGATQKPGQKGAPPSGPVTFGLPLCRIFCPYSRYDHKIRLRVATKLTGQSVA